MLELFAIVGVIMAIVMIASTPEDEYDNYNSDREI